VVLAVVLVVAGLLVVVTGLEVVGWEVVVDVVGFAVVVGVVPPLLFVVLENVGTKNRISTHGSP
jgi:hypothetical protein